MMYRFVLGASGAGKSYLIKQEMIQRGASALDHFALAAKCDQPPIDSQPASEVPAGAGAANGPAANGASAGAGAANAGQAGAENYLYIVPDQYTMQSQKDLVLASGDQGILNIDVLSFGRLSHRIFEELGAPERTPLDDVGKSLILRRVAAGLTKELPVLGSRMGRLGMIAEVKSMISEFMQYDLDVAGVRDLAGYALEHGQGALAARLQDLARLYEAFLQYEEDRYMTGEETLDLLAQMIPQSQWIAQSVIVFDGFTGFTPVQYRVVKALLQTAHEVTFVLTMGEDGGPTAAQTLDKNVPIDPQDLFYLTRHTMRSIIRVAEETGACHGEDIDLTGMGSLPRFLQGGALGHLECALFRYPVVRRESADGRIEIYQSSTPEEEVREMCIRIHRLVREQGYAYRDVAIVCGDLAAYEDAIARLAPVYHLPIYIDRKQAILRNPLTESIRCALEVTAGDYSYNTMFRYLRAGLTALTTEEIDRLENYCLAQGIRTKRHWTSPFEGEAETTMPTTQQEDGAPVTNEDPENAPVHAADGEAVHSAPDAGNIGTQRSMESMRQIVMRELAPLMELHAATAGERTRALYAFLVGVQARERMLTYAARFAEQEDHVRRQEYEQLYHVIIELLDQIYELIGEERISADDYLEIIETGFEEIRVGVLPQRADRILAGDIERSRMPECKVLFFLGANDGNVPKATSKGGLISDLDREFLAGSDAELSPTPREQMYLQRLYLYLNLTKASERLTISYTQTKVDGSSIRPSYLVNTIRQMYGDLRVAVPENYETASAMTDRLVGATDTVQFLAGGIRQFADGMYDRDPAAEDIFCTIYGFMVRRDEDVQRLTETAFSHYHPHPIGKATAEALYGRILSGSVTRLETAAQCMLRHYLQYGLRLQEREERRFENRDAGSILHAAVQRFSEMVRDRGMDWHTFTWEDGKVLADAAYEAASMGYDNGLTLLDARTEGASARMRRVLYRTIRALQYQIQHGEFTPVLFEADFNGASAMQYDLGDGRGVRLRGRIDRVDLCEKDGHVYVKIIDYKSGRKDIDLQQVAEGLQLQLPLYLDAEMDMQQGRHPQEEIIPAGMLYYHLDDPILTGKEARKAVDSWIAADLTARNVEGHSDASGDTGRSDVPASTADHGNISRGVADLGASGMTAPRSVYSEEEIYKALRPTGRVNSDQAVLDILDATREKTSKVIPVAYLKGGGLAKESRVLSDAEFKEMFDRVRSTICRLSGEILDGSVTANPVDEGKQNNACTYCTYKDVCGFDRKLPGYAFRQLGKRS